MQFICMKGRRFVSMQVRTVVSVWAACPVGWHACAGVQAWVRMNKGVWAFMHSSAVCVHVTCVGSSAASEGKLQGCNFSQMSGSSFPSHSRLQSASTT